MAGYPPAIKFTGLRCYHFAIDAARLKRIGIKSEIIANIGKAVGRTGIAPCHTFDPLVGNHQISIARQSLPFTQRTARVRAQIFCQDISRRYIIRRWIAGFQCPPCAARIRYNNTAMFDFDMSSGRFDNGRTWVAPHALLTSLWQIRIRRVGLLQTIIRGGLMPFPACIAAGAGFVWRNPSLGSLWSRLLRRGRPRICRRPSGEHAA